MGRVPGVRGKETTINCARETRFLVLVQGGALRGKVSGLLSSPRVRTWCGLEQTVSRAPTEKVRQSSAVVEGRVCPSQPATPPHSTPRSGRQRLVGDGGPWPGVPAYRRLGSSGPAAQTGGRSPGGRGGLACRSGSWGSPRACVWDCGAWGSVWEPYCPLLNALLCLFPQWWLLEPPGRCLVPPPLLLISLRRPLGKVRSARTSAWRSPLKRGSDLAPRFSPWYHISPDLQAPLPIV